MIWFLSAVLLLLCGCIVLFLVLRRLRRDEDLILIMRSMRPYRAVKQLLQEAGEDRLDMLEISAVSATVSLIGGERQDVRFAEQGIDPLQKETLRILCKTVERYHIIGDREKYFSRIQRNTIGEEISYTRVYTMKQAHKRFLLREDAVKNA